MNSRRVQGLALIIGAVCLLLGLFGSNSTLFRTLGLISLLLFIFGIPAVNTSQPSGLIGLIGIILMVLAAVIALGFNVGVFGNTSLDGALIATSVIVGLAGRIITGWLTIKKQVFSQWLGWGLIAVGVINMAGFMDLGSLASAISIVVTLLNAAVLAVYGIQIFQKNEGNAKVKLSLP